MAGPEDREFESECRDCSAAGMECYDCMKSRLTRERDEAISAIHDVLLPERDSLRALLTAAERVVEAGQVRVIALAEYRRLRDENKADESADAWSVYRAADEAERAALAAYDAAKK